MIDMMEDFAEIWMEKVLVVLENVPCRCYHFSYRTMMIVTAAINIVGVMLVHLLLATLMLTGVLVFPSVALVTVMLVSYSYMGQLQMLSSQLSSQ